MPKHFDFQINTKILKAKSIGDLQKKTNLLFLQGGSKSSDIFLYLAEKLNQEAGINSLLFDHSGFGNSPGKVEESSLETRVKEATEISKLLKSPINLCGFSMGGYTAIKLTEHLSIKNLILFCPGIYDKEAYSVNFGPNFSKIIRKPESWKNSDAFKILNKFTGNLLIVIGDQDEIIPSEIIEGLDKNSDNCKSKEIIYLPNCTHSINNYLQNNPKQLESISKKISNLCLT